MTGRNRCPWRTYDMAEDWQLLARQALQPRAHGVEVDRSEQGPVVEECRDRRGDHHLGVAHAHEFGHDEGRRPHDRRHDLPAGGGHRLDDAAAASGLKPVFFIIGMVSQPSTMTLATAEPEIVPNRLEDTTATLPGPPRAPPAMALAKFMKN